MKTANEIMNDEKLIKARNKKIIERADAISDASMSILKSVEKLVLKGLKKDPTSNKCELSLKTKDIEIAGFKNIKKILYGKGFVIKRLVKSGNLDFKSNNDTREFTVDWAYVSKATSANKNKSKQWNKIVHEIENKFHDSINNTKYNKAKHKREVNVNSNNLIKSKKIEKYMISDVAA